MGARKWLGLASVVTAVALCGCQGGPSGPTARTNSPTTPMANHQWQTRPTAPLTSGPGMAGGSSTLPGAGMTPGLGAGGMHSGGMQPTGMQSSNGFRTPTGAAGMGGVPAGAMLPPTTGSQLSVPNRFPDDPQGFNPGAPMTSSRQTFPPNPSMPGGVAPPPMPPIPGGAAVPPGGIQPAGFSSPAPPPMLPR